jgi:hypothetical protein
VQLKPLIITITGKHIGSQYLKEEKAALLKCNSYTLEENGRTLATLLAGLYHSGDRYFALDVEGTRYLVKKEKRAYYEDEYKIINQLTSEQIGKFEIGLKWLGSTAGKLTTDEAYAFKQKKAFLFFRPGTWKTYKFELSSQRVCIEYIGKYQRSAFSGFVNIGESGKYLEAALGLFIIDERYRIIEESW